MKRIGCCLLALALATPALPAFAQSPPAASVAPETQVYDAELARRTGADAMGMRPYVLVILRSGPTRVPDGDERQAMFAGHMANIARLSRDGKLVLAGPFSKDPDGWRGLFLFAVDDIEEAKALTATDPVIVKGEMVAEYHAWYGSAAAMLLPELHQKVTPPAAATP